MRYILDKKTTDVIDICLMQKIIFPDGYPVKLVTVTLFALGAIKRNVTVLLA